MKDTQPTMMTCALYNCRLLGTWQVTANFQGYKFSDKIPREQLVRDITIPGFQKLSLALVPDVGKSPVSYQLRFVREPRTGQVIEDRAFNLTSIINSYVVRVG